MLNHGIFDGTYHFLQEIWQKGPPASWQPTNTNLPSSCSQSIAPYYNSSSQPSESDVYNLIWNDFRICCKYESSNWTHFATMDLCFLFVLNYLLNRSNCWYLAQQMGRDVKQITWIRTLRRQGYNINSPWQYMSFPNGSTFTITSHYWNCHFVTSLISSSFSLLCILTSGRTMRNSGFSKKIRLYVMKKIHWVRFPREKMFKCQTKRHEIHKKYLSQMTLLRA